MAKDAGLTKMPVIPSVEEFVSKGLYQRATFFGCNKADQLTIVFFPNAKYSFDSNIGTSQFDYSVNDTLAMIANGNLIATQNNDKDWPVCLACGITHKHVRRMPIECNACLDKYCHKP
jgi:lysophospholipase